MRISGIPCPNCGSHDAGCMDSRPQEGYRRRRWKCNGCNERFTTHETIAEELSPFYRDSILDALKSAKAAIEKELDFVQKLKVKTIDA